MFREHPIVQATLQQRNNLLAEFWFTEPSARTQFESTLVGRTVLVVDAEDAFTEMLTEELSAIGLLVTLRKFNSVALLNGKWDLIVMGPGPGDPNNRNDQRIAIMQATLSSLLAKQQPLFAVCLSHQILCLQLGLNVVRRSAPNQGVQAEIDFFGKPELVGFYNTFVAKCDQSTANQLQERKIAVCRDQISNEVHALRGESFVSMQFHPESILTRNGIAMIASSIKGVFGQ